MAVPVILYILLSLPGIQKKIGSIAETELTKLLGTSVEIGGVSVAPFNRVTLRDVSVTDQRGDTVLSVGHLGAGIGIGESLWNNRWVITYAELIDMKVSLNRDSLGSPLNIDPIIARFKKKDTGKKTSFDLAVNMVVIRRSSLNYDVISEPRASEGLFDANHIGISGLRADMRAPVISSELIEGEIKRLAATEHSGLSVKDFAAYVRIDQKTCILNNLSLHLPESHLAFDEISIPSPLSAKINPHLINTRITTLPDTYITPSDLSPLLPVLGSMTTPLDLEIDIAGSIDNIEIERLSATLRDKNTYLQANGTICGIGYGNDSLSADLSRLSVNVSVPDILAIIKEPDAPGHGLYEKLSRLAPLGEVNLLGSLGLSGRSIDFNGSMLTDCGNVDIDCGIRHESKGLPLIIDGTVNTDGFNPSALLDKGGETLSEIAFDCHADLTILNPRKINGTAGLTISSMTYKGNEYNDITADGTFTGPHIDFSLASTSAGLDLTLSGGYDMAGENPATELFADIRSVDLSPFMKEGTALATATISGNIDTSIRGRKPDEISGWLRLEDVTVSKGTDNRNLNIPSLEIEAGRTDSIRTLSVTSPILDASLKGDYTFKGLADDMRSLVSDIFPSIIPPAETDETRPLKSLASLDVTIHPDTTLSRFFKLPVEFIYPVTLHGATDSVSRCMSLRLDAPYLKNKDKLIESTSLCILVNGSIHTCMLDAGTTLPTKNGPMQVSIASSGGYDSVRTGIDWKIARDADFHGELDFSTRLSRAEKGELETRVEFHPTQLVFNDSAWNVFPGTIDIRPGRIAVNGFGGGRHGQSLTINGVASKDSTDRVTVALDHIDLDYIFETLAISDAVNFGGRATGRLFGESLLSRQPGLYTPGLSVTDLSYNHCVMGDGEIVSYWDTTTKDIIINADISQANGRKALVRGFINPLSEALDFRFTADESPVEFMLPFMSAFTSHISGTVSGNAHLFGTFKDLDMEGDIFANNFGLRLDFTNTVYHVTDSVHLRPGRIEFNDVVLSDKYGRNARLSGRVGHRQFHDPTFDFEITDASNLLVYDVGERETEDAWFGRIYGRGGATVTGAPGLININVNMVTEPRSTFTFVLDDREQTAEYNFITFRDRDKARKDSIAALDPTPLIVRQLRDRIRKEESGTPTEYRMEFNVDVTPDATLYLIMDPVGGDKITAHGTGHLRMTYDSAGDLNMWGKYTLNRGSYNFTLQDIVVKDFIIREGSSIEFRGDPYAAQLDITAAYTTNANLSDLDESFLEDPELNRTNVRVNALLAAKGDMRQPEIGFDLEFPSLTADTYRKVRSIISTDEMMDRQIIYLLALNRFYTPDYMSATHGNELVSVASSTLSSRLGSMLGQLSDNWSIAPAIRSDRGDFSDVEVDVALSSHLLDNRLLLNGNLGYRDKSLNYNSFIGDFDIRYLLNRAGTFQLKAYNRYNDQNYYLKSALTTQGIGVVIKREFDTINPFGWLRRQNKNKEKQPADSTKTTSSENR